MELTGAQRRRKPQIEAAKADKTPSKAPAGRSVLAGFVVFSRFCFTSRERAVAVAFAECRPERTNVFYPAVSDVPAERVIGAAVEHRG